MGKALLYYLAQTWTAGLPRQAQHDAPAQAEPGPQGVVPGGRAPWVLLTATPVERARLPESSGPGGQLGVNSRACC
jgi:hypothetical protein